MVDKLWLWIKKIFTLKEPEHATAMIILLMALLSFFILWNIFRAKRGKELFIRYIAGLAAIDEAVGRATEMGRPMIFSLGLGGLGPPTFAGLAVLGYVSQLAAKYGTKLIVPINDPSVFPVAEEVCRESYTREGKLDQFSPDIVRYITSDQFGYAAGVVGLMHREQVASNFMFGAFYAESLLLAEAGQQVGALQVAGTDQTLQIPFFISACDYTVIGEELYAASAYLTKDPIYLGSLVGQDIGKFIILAIIVVGLFISIIFGEKNWFADLFKTLK